MNGRIVREYLGNGIGAHLAEMDVLVRQRERDEQRYELQALHEDEEELADALKELDDACDEAVRAVLTDEGFHQHKGQWRRRRK